MKRIALTEDIDTFIRKTLFWLDKNADTFTYLNPNQYVHYPQKAFRHLIAFGSDYSLQITDTTKIFEALEQTRNNYPMDWLFTFLSYDAKNSVEAVQTNKKQPIDFKAATINIPKHVWEITATEIHILKGDASGIVNQINTFQHTEITKRDTPIKISHLVTRDEYIHQVTRIQKFIQEGNAYEINYCIPFTGTGTLNPVETYLKLTAKNPMPFSCCYKFEQDYILSASPERFIKKVDSTIYSQPIKGTSKRGSNQFEDEAFKKTLSLSEKEKAENTMIVDLVRNDLSRTSIPGSVTVPELSGIYSFPNVHQLISTIRATKDPAFSSIEVIKQAYPMGSMTGAPKVSAMNCIDETEVCARGPFSGTIGYMDPNDDFDFNVLIRSIFYNAESNQVFMEAGSAITVYADAATEYDECMLKIEPMLAILS
ncbi:anthranilate synthase component I family protein [uncultured Cytophaga sp.]|uniref:anthranilate synthase component I family protein n=1 Tax=uncultured Cytophaga sp. TaxID=160238 RepID=UPI0026238C53|nr:anthranilate synthase component I family protein [uncultured Cytophaga sp.]